MDKRSTYLRAFNHHFFLFLARAAEIVGAPENENILVTSGSALMLKKANPSVLIKGWNMNVAIKYQQEIQNGDFDFFADKNYETDLTDFLFQDKIMQMIQKLRISLKGITTVEKLELAGFVKELSFFSVQYSSIIL
jgi:hypothetical protein